MPKKGFSGKANFVVKLFLSFSTQHEGVHEPENIVVSWIQNTIRLIFLTMLNSLDQITGNK